MTVTWLAVEPLDTMMVRDGRAFDAGSTATATAVTPPPTTLGGVVRTAVGADVGRILGPVVSVNGLTLFPAPLDLVRAEGVPRRLGVAERQADEVSDVDDRTRLTHHVVGEGDPIGGWVTATGLAQWLAAEPPVRPGDELWDWVATGFAPDEPWRPEPRLGLARVWRGPRVGTAVDGLLYTASHLRPMDGTRLLVGCVDERPVAVQDDLTPLGGQRRLAHVSVVDGAEILPARPASFDGGRVAVYVATPALLGDVLWHPPQARLCALLTSGSQAVATASPREGYRTFTESKRLCWAVPAGTVFYLEFDDETAALEWARERHGDLLPGQLDLPIVTAGFGLCLTGRW